MHVRTPGAGTGTAASPQVSRPLAAFSLSASASPDRNCCRIICVGNFPRCPGRMVASRVFFHCLRCSCSSSYAEGCRGHVLAQAPPDPPLHLLPMFPLDDPCLPPSRRRAQSTTIPPMGSCSSLLALLREGTDAAVLPRKWHHMSICGVNEERANSVAAI